METSKQPAVDATGTTEQQGREILRRLRDGGFGSDDEKLARALGRPVEEVQAWMTDAGEPVDDDIIMKARSIARARGINLE